MPPWPRRSTTWYLPMTVNAEGTVLWRPSLNTDVAALGNYTALISGSLWICAWRMAEFLSNSWCVDGEFSVVLPPLRTGVIFPSRTIRGAPRIHGELLKLGITVSERTVSGYLPDRR